tara:strand:+ start:7737 stop:8144 length:408 start_codon:yes stop_codon:yes gene_type:complete
MTDAEAFASIALAAVACDGTLGREEAHALRRSLEYRTPYKDRTEQEMGALFDRLLFTLREQGVNQLVTEALPALSPIQQETALAVAVQLTHADRDVSPAEQLFLNQLCERLSLPDGRALAVMEAIMALHRDSLSS